MTFVQVCIALRIEEDSANPPFLNGEQFDQETLRILGVASDDDVKQAIANKIIELAKTGERNPDLLCEHALQDIREAEV
jgi:hypothetical protein